MSDSFILHDKLKETAERFAARTAVEIKEGGVYRSITYGEFYANVRRIASYLHANGLKKGERSAIILENIPEWGMIYFGVLQAGGVAVPIDHQSKENEITNILKDSDAKFVFVSSKHKLDTAGVPSVKKVIYADDPLREIFKSASGECPPADVSIDDTASIIYTSGTVGAPKGVILSHGNFSANFSSIASTRMIFPEDVVLSILPLHHSYPFMINLLTPLFTGCKIVYLAELKPEELLKCSNERGVSILTLVPQILCMFQKGIVQKVAALKGSEKFFFDRFFKLCWSVRRTTGFNPAAVVFKKIHDVFGKRLRVITCGGARLDPEVLEYFMKLGFIVLEGYGLTETSPVVSFNSQKEYRIGSVGRAIPGVEIKIVNPDETGLGEVAVRGASVMKGYYKKDNETEEVFKDGWFLTGDQGRIDPDGFLFLTGRLKEVIVLSSGKNIYPEEIELHYGKSPYIKELCVLDVRRKGGAQAELFAVVVPDYECFKKKGEINVNGIIRWEFENSSRELPQYKRVMGFAIAHEELPKTRLGKLKRYEIREKYSQNFTAERKSEGQEILTDEDKALSESPAGRAILKYLSGRMKRDVKINEHIELDLGVDSLGRVEILSELSAVCKADLPADFLADVFTVKELIVKIDRFITHPAAVELAGARKDNGLLWSRVISEAPTKELLKKVEIKPSLFARGFTHYSRCYFLFNFKFLFGFTVEGRENLPKEGPYIICANHASFLDGPIIASAVNYKTNLNLYFLGYREIFEKGFLSKVMKAIRIIQIDPVGELLNALKICNYVLKHGKIIAIFPEGERSIDGEVKGFKKGTGILIGEAGVPVVPAYIKGSFESWPRTQKKYRYHPVKITFGKPLSAGELRSSAEKGKDIYEGILDVLRREVIKLRNAKP